MKDESRDSNTCAAKPAKEREADFVMNFQGFRPQSNHIIQITRTPWTRYPAFLAHSMGKVHGERVMKWTQVVSKAPP